MGPERCRLSAVSVFVVKTTAVLMARFYFHVRDRDGLSLDREGQELPDLEAAHREAVSASREIIGDKLLHGGSLDERQIEIADENGKVLDVVDSQGVLLKDGKFQSYSDDVTQSAPVNRPRK
jgi:hypothetical protein